MPPDRHWPCTCRPRHTSSRSEAPTCSVWGWTTSGRSRSATTTGSGWTSSARRSPRIDAGGHPPDRGGRQRRHRLDRRRGSARGDRRSVPGGRPLVPRRCGLRRARDARGGPPPAVRGHRTSRFDRVRSAQVALHPAVGRLHRGPRHGADAARLRRRLRGVCREGRGAHRLGDRPRSSLAELQPRLLGLEGLGLPAGTRPEGVRASDLARRRAGAVPGRLRRGARRVRADDAGRPLDHLLPIRAGRPRVLRSSAR